jgi:FG-GAP repeat
MQVCLATRRAPFAGRARALIALIALALAGCLGSSRVATAATDYEPLSASAAPEYSPPAPSVFRLGTAAAPFGWATAIADFNRDGQPDVAIVDRLFSSAAEYEYVLEVSVSSAPAQYLTVASSHDAVTVVVEDLDHDDDLDIVVVSAPTREVVAAWINDGSGRFAASTLHDAPTHLQPRRSISSVSSGTIDAPAVTPTRTALGSPVAVQTAACGPRRCGTVVTSRTRLPRLVSPTSAAPRAPPASLLTR